MASEFDSVEESRSVTVWVGHLVQEYRAYPSGNEQSLPRRSGQDERQVVGGSAARGCGRPKLLAYPPRLQQSAADGQGQDGSVDERLDHRAAGAWELIHAVGALEFLEQSLDLPARRIDRADVLGGELLGWDVGEVEMIFTVLPVPEPTTRRGGRLRRPQPA
jgi:hypothetical protein